MTLGALTTTPLFNISVAHAGGLNARLLCASKNPPNRLVDGRAIPRDAAQLGRSDTKSGVARLMKRGPENSPIEP